jgi:hypothetical protein
MSHSAKRAVLLNSARKRDGLPSLYIALAGVSPTRILTGFNGSASAAYNCDDDVSGPLSQHYRLRESLDEVVRRKPLKGGFGRVSETSRDILGAKLVPTCLEVNKQPKAK